jgi:hypothetical protein
MTFFSEYSTTSAGLGAHVEVTGSKDFILAACPTIAASDID